MNGADFCKGFHFHIFKLQRRHFTDHSREPAALHYFGCLIKGTATIKTENRELSVVPGEVFYIPKGLFYQSRWLGEKGGDLEWYSFGFEICPSSSTYALQKIQLTDGAGALFDDLCREIPFTEKGIGKLYRFFGEIADTMELTGQTYRDPIVKKATSYINRQPNARMAAVARYCNVSQSGLYSLFRRHTGKTPNQVRQEAQCRKAVLLLTTTNRSVQQISDETGFSSVSYFRKILRKYTGKTPLQIRKEAAF